MLESDTDWTGRLQGRGNIFVHFIVRRKNPEASYFPLFVVQEFPNYVCALLVE